MEWQNLGLDIDGEAASDLSGYSVSLSADGSRVAIGAIGNDGNGSSNTGHVRIYDYDFSSSAWVQMGSDIDGEAAGDESGYSVSLSADGTRVAIGARYNDGTATNAGHVRIYEWNGTAWSQLGLDIDGEAAVDNSGYSVSLSADGTRVAIGASTNDRSGYSDAGHVRIYEWNGTAWSKVGSDIDGEAATDYSGYSVSLSEYGTRVAIGAIFNDPIINGTTASNAGHVRIYEWNGTAWSQVGQDINGEAASDRSGWSVSLSADGTRVAIGARFNDGSGSSDDAGHVRIYELTNGDWVQMGEDINGEAASDGSGYSVSLSADGTRVAIGAILNDGTGTDAGHVRIYEFSTTTDTWSQVGQDIDGEAENDLSGWSVSLSADGLTVAIGASYNDGSGSSAGHVRIYELITTPTLTNFSIPSQNYSSGATFTISPPQSNSTGAFSYISENTEVATISGTTVTILQAGDVTITATQEADDNYTSGTTSAILTISSATPTLTNFSIPSQNYSSGATFTISPPQSNSTGAFTYTSSNTTVATISGTTVTIVGAGSSTITATQAETSTYTSGTITATLTVSAAPTTTTTTEAPTHQTILSLESVGTSMNETTGKTNYVWQLKATTTSL